MQTILCEWQYIKKYVHISQFSCFLFNIATFFMSSQTDVIVNTASKYCWKSGEVSRAILRKAGWEMERELEKASAHDFIITTKAYKLSCKEVYHTVCPESLDDNSAQVEYDLNS